MCRGAALEGEDEKGEHYKCRYICKLRRGHHARAAIYINRAKRVN